MSNTISEKQLAANRANALRSTGPRTVEGKSRARMNSLVHGLRSQDLLLPAEDAAALDELRESYLDQYRPVGAVELFCVEKILQAHWRARRIPNLESTLYQNPATCLESLSRLSRYETSLDRAYYRALQELRQLQADRIGFVSHEPEYEPEPAAPPEAEMGSLGKTCTAVQNIGWKTAKSFAFRMAAQLKARRDDLKLAPKRENHRAADADEGSCVTPVYRLIKV